ncbi:TonB-dependent receptor [Uliginosibacterium gangwonense]|uniref:TonB-dependent receptor n=1 Tax=Uliginosibacterium gangwonense TaxID=392736 RepID=UPI0003A7D40A|nr:TonB-dependent siderophore receptor [Uliginosibacterium gangwonense]
MRFSSELFSNAPSRLISALATGAVVSSAAVAAEPTASTAEADKTLQPVVVQGERDGARPERSYKTETTTIGKQTQAPKDIPQSITIVPEKLIADRKEDSLKSALQNVAGLTFNAGEGGRIGDNINLRGYVAYGDLYQDGMRDIAQYNREVFNLERIEVLRGAASMLFGRGSTGGVINQVSKSPFLADETVLNATVGNNDYLRTTADINQVIGETTAIRLNTMTTNSAGDPDGADSKRYGFAPTLRTGIGTNNEFEVGYYHLNYDDTPNYGFGWAGGRPVDSAADHFYGLDSDFQRDSADVLTTKYTHRFSNKTQLTSTLRYGEYKRDLWATTARPISTLNVTDSSTFTRGSQRRGGEEHHLFNQTDLTTRFDAFGMKHEALVGTELAREDSERWGYAGTPAKSGGTVGNPEATSNQSIAATGMRTGFSYFTASTLGLYGQDMIEFLPRWKLLLGARWDRFSGDYSSGADSTAARFQRKDYLWSYRTGLIRELTDNLNVYAAYGSSFNTSGDLYQYDSSSAKTKPEQSRNIELGTKSEWLDGKLSTRFALFRTEKYNERSTDTETAAGEYLLSGKRHTDGYEIEINGELTKNWDVFFNVAHMWSNIDKAGSAATAAATVGRPSANTPTNSGSLWTTYRFMPNWTVGAGADGQSKRNPSHNSSNWAPGYVKYDAMLKYEQPRYSVQLNVINLFDRIYWQSVYNGHAVAGARRTVQLTTELRL